MIKLKNLKYYFMSDEQIIKRLKVIKQRLEEGTSMNERIKLFNEVTDITVVVIKRQSQNKPFIKYVDDEFKKLRARATES